MLSKEVEKEVIRHLNQIRLLLFLEKEDTKARLIVSVVNKMPDLEKDIITRKYLHRDSEYTRHQMIYKDMEISHGLYGKVRLRGLFKIALVLGLTKTMTASIIQKDWRQERMLNENFLSVDDNEALVSFLYESGIYITLDLEREGQVELQQAMKKLEPLEAEVIARKYLSREAEYTRHQAVYKELGLSSGTYKKYRLRALTKLAAKLSDLIK
ncbi:hypothetical protein [Paenibacillus piscarius]|uniref:hypothetical protein n=1 Tax=Paenibacillus piscarius TaxID=1089681 RepID=UPI001EE7DA57|nr:hypothetical protein [Paenibacillus piscarius]